MKQKRKTQRPSTLDKKVKNREGRGKHPEQQNSVITLYVAIKCVLSFILEW